jgi:LacI family transcriptional regulator
MSRRPVAFWIALTGGGSHRRQDQNETGFRSFFSEHARKLTVLEALMSLEESSYSAKTTPDPLDHAPDLVGLHVTGGGI